MLPVLQTILVRAAGPAKTGRVLTIVMLVSTIAPIAGPLVGGAIVNSASWRWVFVIMRCPEVSGQWVYYY